MPPRSRTANQEQDELYSVIFLYERLVALRGDYSYRRNIEHRLHNRVPTNARTKTPHRLSEFFHRE